MYKSLLFLLLALALGSCGGESKVSVEDLIAGGTLEEIKEKQQELNAEQRAISASLRQLDSVIHSKEQQRNIPLVSTLELKISEFEHYLDLQGNVQTKQNILLYPEMAGTLIKVYVTDGQAVRKGQVLAKIDDGGMASGLEQLRTQAALAKTTYERQNRLWEQNIGSEIQYLQTKTNYEATLQAVQQAEAQLSKSTIRAPFSGIVDDVMVDEGSTVNPAGGMPIIRLVNLTDMYVEVDVPESYLREVTPGKRVELFIPVLGDSMITEVRQTGNFINPANRTFKVEVSVPNTNGQIKPNLTVRVRINDYTNPEALLVPPGIISENSEGQQYVYVATEIGADQIGKAEKRVITTGLSQKDQIEVLSGVQSGEQLILEGARRVREGQKIEIIEQI
ncbi:MAG: efflux RND transporter periplasmic adaptor subunit [Robiginitalea sp.]|uniref:efflux RND transporter periplasmic adaptor subunit n=1 Tax=Robiginitalea sp. TaxID=1902411 RepID=UPI003C7957A7